jgi:hypothetical protein
MTSEELRQTAAAMLAFDAGKPIEVATIGLEDWDTVQNGPTWQCYALKYRPKPEIKTRPMTRAEFPFGAGVRQLDIVSPRLIFPTSITEGGIQVHITGHQHEFSWQTLADYYEYTMNGVDFHPCTVTE